MILLLELVTELIIKGLVYKQYLYVDGHILVIGITMNAEQPKLK